MIVEARDVTRPNKASNLPAEDVNVTAVPLGEDGRLDRRARHNGWLSETGDELAELTLAANDSFFPGRSLFLMNRGNAKAPRFVGVNIKETRREERTNRLRLTVARGGVVEDILQSEALVPALSTESLMYQYRFPQALLDDLTEEGALSRELLDRVLVCPKCHALPPFRLACPACGSARTCRDSLFHHFACGHVGLTETFDTSGGLRCPKCRTRNIVIGADYEELPGLHHCQDCPWEDSELEMAGHCLACDCRFPLQKAHVQDLYRFYAE